MGNVEIPPALWVRRIDHPPAERWNAHAARLASTIIQKLIEAIELQWTGLAALPTKTTRSHRFPGRRGALGGDKFLETYVTCVRTLSSERLPPPAAASSVFGLLDKGPSVPSLREQFFQHVQGQQRVAPSPLIGPHHDSIAATLDFMEVRPECQRARQRIASLFSDSNFLLDSKKFQEFTQVVGEIQFLQLAAARSVVLSPIAETDGETPDFDTTDKQVRFEVKTPSIKGGESAIGKITEESYEGQLELDAQLRAGKSFATNVQEVAPHGPLKRGKEYTTMCKNLVDKIRSNLKPGQFATPPTLLVFNMLLLDSHFSDPADLRPVVAGYPRAWSLASGTLWNAAFGEPEQLVYFPAEFEGAPAIEGTLGVTGILKDAQYDYVTAILLIAHRWRESPMIFGLRRHDDAVWEDHNSSAAETFHKLVGDNWNDDRDSNGWALAGRG